MKGNNNAKGTNNNNAKGNNNMKGTKQQATTIVQKEIKRKKRKYTRSKREDEPFYKIVLWRNLFNLFIFKHNS